MGSILIDDKEANNSLSKVEKKSEGVGKKLGSMIGTAAKWGAGVALGAGAVVGGMVALGNKVGNIADKILDLESITGMGTTAIQEWRKVAEVAGTAEDAMANASIKFTKSLDTMSVEGHKGQEALSALGLSLEDIENMSADERMNAISTALAGVEDKTDRATIGADLFGGTWKEIAPIVDLGTEAMNKAKDSANIISEEDLKKANDFRISVADMKDQVSFFVTEIGIKLLPMLQSMFDWVQAHMPQIKAVTEMVFRGIGTAITFAIEWVRKIIDWFRNMKTDGESQFGELFSMVKEYLGLIVEGVQAFIALFMEFWDKYGENIVAVLKAAFDLIMTILKVALDIVMDVFKIFIALFKGDWEGLWQGVKDLFATIWNGIGDILVAAFKLIIEQAKLYLNILGDSISKIFMGIKEGILGIWDGIVKGIKGYINLILDGMNFMIKQMNKISFSIPDWVPKVGGKSFGINIPKIPMLAEGGNILDDGSVMVGEQGPEILSDMKGARVTPLEKSNNQDKYIIIENYMDGKKIGESVARPLGQMAQSRGRGLGLAT